MVLDIRHLSDDGDEESKPPSRPPAETEPMAPVDADLEALVTAAMSGDAARQTEAVASLRVLVPTDDGFERLCRIVDDRDDPRRLAAIQVLGFHRQWLFSRSSVQRVLAWARVEADPAAATALAWVLRQREAVQEFLLHPVASMAREAAIGLPVNPATIDALLDALLVGRSPDVDRVLTEKLAGLHPSLAARAVEHLLAVADCVTADALTHVLSHLPQPPVFELFVEGRSQPAWTAEPTPQDRSRQQRWRQVARLASQVLQAEPQAELIRYLVNRSVGDETFSRRHAVFLQTAMSNTREVIGADMLDDLERLTVGASEDRVELMAKLLMSLGDKIAGGDSHSQMADLLEKWKSMSPGLKLKIFHLQQGLK
jgi:hypothetical protein